MIASEFIIGLWALFWVVWLVSAFGVKRDIKSSRPVWVGLMARIVVLTAAVYLIETRFNNRAWTFARQHWGTPDSPIAFVGAAVCALGIGFAFWARFHLGRNWSPAPAIKVEHELVTSGPYRFVRHPIYTGILVALVGSALAGGVHWLVPLLVCIVVFVARVKNEEGIMLKLFPNQYPDYRKRTKALIPYVV